MPGAEPRQPRLGGLSVGGGNRPARHRLEQDDGAVLRADAGTRVGTGSVPIELGAGAAGSGGSGRSGRR